MSGLLCRHGEGPVAWCRGRAVSRTEFLSDLHHLAARLPEAAQVVNLCEDRYHFLVAFGAALLRGQVSLLPASRTPHVLRQTVRDYPGLYALVDGAAPAGMPAVVVERAACVATDLKMPDIPEEQLAAIVFTSGSTGRSRPNLKRWGSLAAVAALAGRRFGLDAPAGAVLATVPPQHMYGLEASILLPIRNGWALEGSRPFFPADIQAALQRLPPKSVLVTTPLHLKACVESGLTWPAPRFILSATAPLSQSLAARAEACFGAPVFEIYGFTEAGSVASRRTVEGAAWRCFDGVRLEATADGFTVVGPHLDAPVAGSDLIECTPSGDFVLRGRSVELINIAGKRIALGELNAHLNEIPGVRDGIFFMPDDDSAATVRLAAFVVAPELTPEGILAALRERIDPVFLPRPLHRVGALPRTETGKLPRERLQALWQKLHDVKAG